MKKQLDYTAYREINHIPEKPSTPLLADRMGATDAHPRVTVASVFRTGIRWAAHWLPGLAVAALLIAVLLIGIRLTPNQGAMPSAPVPTTMP